jgi:hypothetical protein
MVSTRVDVASVHGAFAIAFNVSVTDPAVASAALGVYVGFSAVVLLKEPVPELVHRRDDWLVAVAPLNVYATPSQIVAASPAFAVGAFTRVMTIASVALAQAATDAVSVSVVVPAVISAALGV